MEKKADRADSWRWSSDEIRRVGHRVVDLIADHISTLPEKPVFQPFPPDLAARYLEESPAPETGESADEILTAFQSEVMAYPFGNGHPRFYGWVNSPPALLGVFADALASAMNPSCAGGNHAAIYVERQVLGWFKRLLGLPTESMGLFVSGGSMAALTGLAVARHAKCGFDIRAQGLQGDHPPLVFYKTAEGHGCNQKAIEMLGIGADHLRLVDQDAAKRMIPASLEAMIKADIALGKTPVAVIASAGAVNTGAIDPLSDIADICRRYAVWMHVDGAYGAPAILSAQYNRELAAIGMADSVAVDPHKWLYVPVEAGLVLVRDAKAMRAAFSLTPPYLRTDGEISGIGGPPWFSEFGFQQTRGFRALKVWMAIKFQGVEGYRKAIEKDIESANELTRLLQDDPDFQVFEPQSLSIVCFRYLPAAIDEDKKIANSLNQRLLKDLQLGGKAFLSSTVMDDIFWLRACIINPLTSSEDIKALIEIVRSVGSGCLSLSDPTGIELDAKGPEPAKQSIEIDTETHKNR